MHFFLAALAVLLSGGLAATIAGRRGRIAAALAAAGAVVAVPLAATPAIGVLASGKAIEFGRSWSVPLGSFSLRLDPLAALFVLPVVLVGAAAAVYGIGYMSDIKDRALGPFWLFFNVLVASMLLVVTAANGVLFLAAWEIMTLSSFFLVMFESDREEVRRAGLTYLVASHLGTAFLFAMFAMAVPKADSLDFRSLSPLSPAALLLAFVGFGTKAGFVPLHVWLPEAHPAAPSHVSAVMSGVMIKMGIYGLVRMMVVGGPAAEWFGWLLIAAGAASAVLGALNAVAQQDLKRVLAYSSVENVGIIALGLGIGLLGESHGQAAVAVMGYGGALLQMLNHAALKSLLFLVAGAVLHGCGTLRIDRLGGLLKAMPRTATAAVVGAAGISALPPLGSFLAELLIYLAAFSYLIEHSRLGEGRVFAAVAAIAALALSGGLAAACFTRAMGAVFLGEPRSQPVHPAHGPSIPMGLAMGLLALFAVGLSLAASWVMGWLVGPISALASRLPAGEIARVVARAQAVLIATSILGCLLVTVAVALVFVRRRLLVGRWVEQEGTWDCGYAAPTARMQYTASSYGQPLVALFRRVIASEVVVDKPEGLFPHAARLETRSPDLFSEWLFSPGFAAMEAAMHYLRWLQQGRIQLYVLYIAVTLLVLLVWKLG